jgi:guanylate kinase
MPAPLFIVSGPSGAGKSTLLRRVLAEPEPPLRLSVSATTRLPRPGEVDGREYHFWKQERFDVEVKAGGFLEWAGVHGKCYGTLRSEVEPYRERGVGVFLDIDVQGAAQVCKVCPDAVTMFIRTASPATFEERLRKRGTETEEQIRRRVQAAARELEQSHWYHYQVFNDDLEKAVADVRRIVLLHFAESQRSDPHAG